MLPALVAAGASLASSFFSKASADKANKQAAENARRQEELQREFAQSGIQWKVEDAKKAGIHPIYALGAQTTSYAPVSVGSTTPDWSGLSQAGQHIGRAVQSTQTIPAQQAAAMQAMQAAQLESVNLDNDIKRAELASRLATTGVGKGPGIPAAAPSRYDPFEGVSGDAVKIKGPEVEYESKLDVGDKSNPAYIPGTTPETVWSRNATGGYSPRIAPQLAEALESDNLGALDWFIRNRLGPVWSRNWRPPAIPHNPYTEDVVWNAAMQQVEVRPKRMSRNLEVRY